MDKQSYETYEFLATTPIDSDTNQFFVLQDDTTILTVNKQIQYITQVDDAKGVIEGSSTTEECATVLQQYYVDVENNAPEIISINDQFAITNSGSNVYPNSYLIQPEASQTEASEEMETEPMIDPQKLDSQHPQLVNIDEFGTKQTNRLTEITLSDEQYQTLEKKGWLLLESNEKIFVLNTLGLHDITSNDKLIQKLKNELQNQPDSQSNVGQLRIESVTTELTNENVEKPTQKQDDVVEFFTEKHIPIQNVELVVQYNNINENGCQELDEPDKSNETKEYFEVETLTSGSNKLLNEPDKVTQKRCDSIKINTKYTFKDIPDKIFLGKTVNGKNLYAKVRKYTKANKETAIKSQGIIYGKKIDKVHDVTTLEESQFTNLIQDSFRDMSKLSPLSIQYAGAIVSQLLRLSYIDSSIVESNLVVTKLTTFESETGKEIGQPTMVSGTVRVVDGEQTFIHQPQLLVHLLEETEGKAPVKDSTSECPDDKIAKGVIDLFHIHVSQTSSVDKPPETSITFTKRKLSLDVLSDAKKRHPNPVYACGSCGAVFKSAYLLKDHQNDQCIEVDDQLTIDTDDFNTDKEVLYTVVGSGNEKLFSCVLCETKFTRLFNCQKHIKAHKIGKEKKLKSYKCKMCPKTYFYTSSLSKHIVKEHIQVQSN